MGLQLSPYNRRAAMHRLGIVAKSEATMPPQAPTPADEKEARRRQLAERRSKFVETVTVYRCTECDTEHDDKDEAAMCCAPPIFGSHSADPSAGRETKCPVCGEGYSDHYGAAHCCLWRDLAHPQREAIAARVEAGATWVDALELKP